ncbi:MAG: hypothetical protein A3I11_03795 [Elusimicrobia bacterium RIFCSPLOWO2_02_FULL_39_32]|nr:MAG: hypothetical protein A3B80_02370 [Elusimicrobia bacterium RIFCSPHIGHO2_02_FULL_39_36]OGR92830.1 MAG: hypothetical protein A3I11_03795 [Elusimicrobia bacterium RIFCSPLOWO2_02_FULL_39_32]OGR99614.1 MAG: hypothetical protein A3G85_01155 [Elusimicrobia bacterium RIFCSPLOWO2_12_FULL_39_28]
MSPAYCWSFFAFCSTLLGAGILFIKREWTKIHIWRILAFVSGILLGSAFIKILPEANSLSPQYAGLGAIFSFLLIFALEGFTMMHSCLEYTEPCEIHYVSWVAFVSLALHSIFDGLAISIAFQKNIELGLVVASAILIHKITDGLTLTGLLLKANYSNKKSLLVVILVACATPLGTLFFNPFSSFFSDQAMGWWLGFIAGTFFYIGAADILPRLHKVKDIYCLGSFVFGIAVGGFPF